MQADPLYRCWDHICQEAGAGGYMVPGVLPEETIYLSPCGRVFDQQVAKELKGVLSTAADSGVRPL